MLSTMALRSMNADLGPAGATRKLYELLGLGKMVGTEFVRNVDLNSGRPVLESQHLKPESMSLKALALGLIGEDCERGLKTPAHQQVDVLEAGTEIVPSTFANISAFNAVAAGLLEAKMLEVYNRPTYIAESLVENIPSRMRSEKFVGISSVGDSAEERKPGNRHPRIELSERYVTTPLTVNRANGVDVTREAVMFDLTNQVLTQCEGAAESLRLRKEYNILDVVLGIVNPYNYNGTAYSTYVASGGLWVNWHQNPFTNWNDIDEMLQLLVGMTDPETGEPIDVTANQILCMPSLCMQMNYHLSASGIEKRTATTMADVAIGANPVAGMFEVVNGPTYPYAYKRALAADGLNLSATNAKGMWIAGQFTKAFAYVENLPLTIVKANAADYEMADRGLVFSMFCDEMGIAAVKDPRYVIKNSVEAPS